MKWMQRNIAALVVAGALSVGLAGPTAAQVNVGDGLVNVQIGNVRVLNNLNIGVAAEIVAQICDIKVSDVAILAELVDASGQDRTVCRANGGPVTITQNQ
jgi:hypothetical protein